MNPTGRFEPLQSSFDAEDIDDTWVDPDTDPPPPGARTVLLKDTSRTVIVENDSDDVGFERSVNPYRGCEHGCAYCYARPYHEYLGFSAGLDFETRILVKEDAPNLLRAALRKPGYEPKSIAFSGVTDAWQPIERRLRITRQCLEVLHDARHPVGAITKNHLILRDLDLFADLAIRDAARVAISVTTLDPKLSRALEPRASTPSMRLHAIRKLTEAGVPTLVMVAPIIPGLNDHEVPRILEAAAEAGAMGAGYTVVRLPHGVKDIFLDWLERHVPLRKAKVIARIHDLRGGRLNDPRRGTRMSGEGAFAKHLASLVHATKRRLGLDTRWPPLSTAAFRRPDMEMPLFGM